MERSYAIEGPPWPAAGDGTLGASGIHARRNDGTAAAKFEAAFPDEVMAIRLARTIATQVQVPA